MTSDPCAVLLTALTRQRQARQRQHRTTAHPFPQLVPTPTRWCGCGQHLANEGGDTPTRCPVCADQEATGA